MTKRGRPRKERYARLMGGFWKNEKIRRLSLEARGLLATAWSYAASEATDGKIPIEMLEAWVSQSMRGQSMAAKAKRYEAIMAELTRGEDRDGARALLTLEEGAIDAIAHDWTDINITVEQWEKRLEADRKRKAPGRDFPPGKGDDIPTGIPPDIPTGTPAIFQGSALDDDEDSLRERSPLPPTRPRTPDPMAPDEAPEAVVRLHDAWKTACGYPQHKLRAYGCRERAILAEAIEAYGLEACLLVAEHAPSDGMVNGSADERRQKHDTIRYIFDKPETFNRILRAAHEARGKVRHRRSAAELVEEARRL